MSAFCGLPQICNPVEDKCRVWSAEGDENDLFVCLSILPILSTVKMHNGSHLENLFFP